MFHGTFGPKKVSIFRNQQRIEELLVAEGIAKEELEHQEVRIACQIREVQKIEKPYGFLRELTYLTFGEGQ